MTAEPEGTSRATWVFPVWYRPELFLPVIGVFYLAIPLNFPFMNLLKLPYFLSGGSDWGGGNVFTYSKIFLWGALILGSIANTLAVRPLKHAPLAQVTGSILRHNRIHLLCLGLLCLAGPNWKTLADVWKQVGFLLAYLALLVPTIAASRRVPLLIALTVAVALAAAWGFVPLGITPPG